jgi:deoxyribonuclease V
VAFALYDEGGEGQDGWENGRETKLKSIRQTRENIGGEMRVAREHAWDVTIAEARAIQERLRGHWEGEDCLGKLRTVAGLDAAFVLTGSQAFQAGANHWNLLRRANQAIGCVVQYGYPEMEEMARAYAVLPLGFPYVPGFLSFREIPVLLAALGKLPSVPDLLFCDGQGYAHPRRMGLATHLGIVLDVPTIGCAKSLLIGKHGTLGKKAGSWAPLVDPSNDNERIGAALRTRDGVKPIYVSQGNRIALPTTLKLVLEVSRGYRMPQPTRDADRYTKEIQKKLAAEQYEK